MANFTRWTTNADVRSTCASGSSNDEGVQAVKMGSRDLDL